MNNDQFRRLVLDQPGKNRADNNNAKTDSSSSPSQVASAALGSRLRTSIPMTPRSVKGSNHNLDFARQLAEHRREEMQPPTKRFKSSAAPKGTKLASGYQDRTALRRLQEQGDKDERDDKSETKEDVAQRLKALEDMVKLGQIDIATFEKLRREIGVGGDLGSTHMVKGLDWDLLKRVKAGEEDLSKKEEEEDKEEEIADVDDELDRVLEQKEDNVSAPPKEKRVKKGNLAPAPGKMSRDEILRQLKASRAAAAAAAEATPESTLSTKFKKIKDDKPEKKRWIETDPTSGRRKEILVITDAEGKTKRKVRWLDKKEDAPISKFDNNGLLLPSQDAKPLGMEVPAVVAAKIAAEAAAEAEAEDDDIFAGVGTDYNPLGDLDDSDDDDDDDDVEKEEEEKTLADKPIEEEERLRVEPSQQAQARARRNYFNDKKTQEETDTRNNPLTTDPTLLAALKRAAALRQARDGDAKEEGEADEEEGMDIDADPERLARRKKFFEEAARRDAQDALDLDYGFGSSRIEDEEDEEGPTFDGQQRGGGNKRKRGPKKKKGDKNSAADVLGVMEGRKNQ